MTSIKIKSSILGYLLAAHIPHAATQTATPGTIIAWGDALYGATTPGTITDVSQAICGGLACGARKTDGTVIAWGKSDHGAGAPALTDVSQITCGGQACVALKDDGSIVAWGKIDKGGALPHAITDVAQVSCGWNACTAVKNDGTVISWGDARYGGATPSINNVSKVSCGGYACTALKNDGTIHAWGSSSFGANAPGHTDVSQIECGGHACAALKNDGSVVAWGDTRYGGTTGGAITDVSFISCSWHACVALKNDGSLFKWGEGRRGGDIPSHLSDIIKLDCGRHACAAIRSDQSVVAWGEATQGGNTGGSITGVSHISCGYACVAYDALDSAGGGGDPHYYGFGGLFFTWQGHCDAVLLKSPSASEDDINLEVHMRTTRVRQWSKIDAIAFQAGQHFGEINSDDGKLILDGHEINSFNNSSLTVSQSKFRKNLLYTFEFPKNKKMEVKVNIRTQMIYVTASGSYPKGTQGVLGSPHNPGFISRDGVQMGSKDVNAFVESWQVRDSDLRLFHVNRPPQFPLKCMYNIKEIKRMDRRTRALKEKHTVSMNEAVAACAMHVNKHLRSFCIDDVMMTGDIDLAQEDFL